MITANQREAQRLVFVALTVLTAISLILDMVSDVFLRNTAHHYDAGSSPASWDWFGAGLVAAWTVQAIYLWRKK